MTYSYLSTSGPAALLQKYHGMTFNALNHRSKTSFKHFTPKHDEKLCILKMCRKKLKVLQKKDSIAKTVLIRNTLKKVETQQNISDSFLECDGEKENIFIETLLRELDDYNHQLSSSKDISTINDSISTLKSQILEDFHTSETRIKRKPQKSERFLPRWKMVSSLSKNTGTVCWTLNQSQ